MKMIILSLRDIRANYYLPPIFVNNMGAALRDLTDQINTDKPVEAWQKHPADFELWELGTWQNDDASFDVAHDASQTQPKQLLVLDSLKR